MFTNIWLAYHVTESLVARRPVRQPVRPVHVVVDGEARRVEVLPAAPHAGVLLRVTHARLQPHGLAVGHALAGAALALLHAGLAVRHGDGGGALGLGARALGFLLAGRKVGRAAVGALGHEAAV